jgi:hypothetical protein
MLADACALQLTIRAARSAIRIGRVKEALRLLDEAVRDDP